ncbi:MAG: TolC family protein [Marinobacter sp.]|nr:TolC family protein [Marinobacter sp.]
MATMLAISALPAAAQQELDLTAAIEIALQDDPWLQGSVYQEQALREDAVAQGALPDPRLTLGLANLPTDTFDLGQEAMTQTTIGFTQRFPRGDSRHIAKARVLQMASIQPRQRDNRVVKVTETVSHLWLDVWRAQQSVQLIESNRGLFEQLEDVAQAGYRSATMGARLQDVIRASVELTRLDDRLTALTAELNSSREALAEWVASRVDQMAVANTIPSYLTAVPANGRPRVDSALAIDHPMIRATDKLIETRALEVDLARQAYKPEWSLSAQYGYRDKAPNGQDRADFFSVGISVDLPLFTGNRQDRNLNASVARAEAVKTERTLQLRQLQASARSARVRIERLDERITRYRETLLPQMEQQAEAALSAYNSDDGDFAEAVRARIAELNARIELVQMVAERAKSQASFNYVTAGADNASPFSSTRYQD